MVIQWKLDVFGQMDTYKALASFLIPGVKVYLYAQPMVSTEEFQKKEDFRIQAELLLIIS